MNDNLPLLLMMTAQLITLWCIQYNTYLIAKGVYK